MPGEPWNYTYPNESRRITAWLAHYVAIGCNSTKAERLAFRKIWRSRAWPQMP